MTRTTLARIGIGILVGVTLAFFAVALMRTWDEIGSLPAAPPLIAAGLLWAIGLTVASIGWANLLGPHDTPRHAAAFLVSQIGKYVPGGVGQLAGQVGLARSSGVPVRRAIVALAVMSIAQAGAGAASLIALGAGWAEPRGWLRVVLGVCGLAGVFLALDRRWMIWALSHVRRFRESVDDVPEGSRIRIAWGANLVALVCTSCGYALVLGSLVPVDDPILVATAFAASWTVGFIVVPVPSGLGIRELTLVAVLSSVGYSGAVLVGASAIHRLVTMLAEAAIATIATVVLRRRNVPTPFEVVPTGGDAPSG